MHDFGYCMPIGYVFHIFLLNHFLNIMNAEFYLIGMSGFMFFLLSFENYVLGFFILNFLNKNEMNFDVRDV